MKVYRSKIDWWLIIIIFIVFCYPMIEGILSKDYVMFSVSFGVLSLVFLMFKSIKYKIDGENLQIWWTKIDIKSIRKIYSTNNPLSSPALSLDRIAVVYNKYDEVLISPKERADFIQELLKINPNIEVVT
ncbi:MULTISPECIES: PH domain-containing protein [unclassified Flavobacterium]|uniref:PH domain-containing protein n=2 Tax=Flavobacterium TaxID=237 RepID=UPI000EAD933C|nr:MULTISPECIES: PH domain-containing protein [unclassified Flavobacterium]RKS01608.1 PH (Pleckstrin Homology) domain-containing protein [Flavobacterium sp. 102]